MRHRDKKRQRFLRARQDNQVVVLVVVVTTLEPLGEVVERKIKVLSRKTILKDPEGRQILADLDIAVATGKAPLLVFLADGELRKGLTLGMGGQDVGAA